MMSVLFDETASRRGMRKAEKVGIWLAAVTLSVSSAIALGAWLWPMPPQSPEFVTASPGPAAAPSTESVDTVPTTAPAAPRHQNATYLAELSPQSGGANLAELPRALNGKAGYGHLIVVRCPTNQSDDKVRAVTYPLRGRYLDFSATVRPYDTAVPDGHAYVTAVAGFKERDGTLTRQTAGTQFGATAAGAAPLSATVERAEELTIQVRCESPQGVVVLSDAKLIPAT
jgi:hypothetical protein